AAILDADGRIVHVSPRWFAVTGWPEARAIGVHWIDLVLDDDKPAAVAAGRQAVRDGRSAVYEGRVVNPDGGFTWVSARAAPLRDAEGNVDRWVLVADDLSEHKEAEEALRRSERRLQ